MRGQRGELAAADVSHGRGFRIPPLGQRADDDIAVRQDAYQSLVIEHDHVADIAPPHELGGVHDGLRALDRVGVRSHDVSDIVVHDNSPLVLMSADLLASAMPRCSIRPAAAIKSLRPVRLVKIEVSGAASRRPREILTW